MAELSTIDAAELIDQAEHWVVDGELSDALLDALAALLLDWQQPDQANASMPQNPCTEAEIQRNSLH